MSEELRWFKSGYSNMESACVEAAFAGPRTVLMRDTRHREASMLRVGSSEWVGLMTLLATGRG